MDAISDGKHDFANRHDLTKAPVWQHSVDQYQEKDHQTRQKKEKEKWFERECVSKSCP